MPHISDNDGCYIVNVQVQKDLIGRKPGTVIKRSQSVEKKRSSSPYRSTSPAPGESNDTRGSTPLPGVFNPYGQINK